MINAMKKNRIKEESMQGRVNLGDDYFWEQMYF